MSFEFKSPKYLREFVLSQCIGTKEKIETIARKFTINRLGPVPPIFSKAMNDYSKSMATDYKRVRVCCSELLKAGLIDKIGLEHIQARAES